MMQCVTADDIRNLRRDEALALALTRHSGSAQSLKKVPGRILTAAWNAAVESGRAPELRRHQEVGQAAHEMARVLALLVPAAFAAAEAHQSGWRDIREAFGLDDTQRDPVLSRFGARVGRLALGLREVSGGVPGCYEEAAREVSLRVPADPPAPADPGLMRLREQVFEAAGSFATGNGVWGHLLSQRGLTGGDFACRCQRLHASSGVDRSSAAVEVSYDCLRHEISAEAQVIFLGKVDRALELDLIRGASRFGSSAPEEIERWLWPYARSAMADALSTHRRAASKYVELQEAEHKEAVVCRDPFAEFIEQVIDATPCLPGMRPAVARWLHSRGVQILWDYDDSPRPRRPGTVCDQVAAAFMQDNPSLPASLARAVGETFVDQAEELRSA